MRCQPGLAQPPEGATFVYIGQILVEGNRKTKTNVILRELTFSTGDTILVDELGDLYLAADRAQRLASLESGRHVHLVDVLTPGDTQLPLPDVTSTGEWVQAWVSMLREGTMAIAPWRIRIRPE